MTSTAMFAVISEVVQAVSNVYYETYNMMLFAEEFLACYWLAAGLLFGDFCCETNVAGYNVAAYNFADMSCYFRGYVSVWIV